MAAEDKTGGEGLWCWWPATGRYAKPSSMSSCRTSSSSQPCSSTKPSDSGINKASSISSRKTISSSSSSSSSSSRRRRRYHRYKERGVMRTGE